MLSIGLMSGTSADGIDVSLIKTDGELDIQLIADHHLSYENKFRNELKDFMRKPSFPWFQLEQKLTVLHAQAVNELLVKTNLKPEQIDIVGFHGQTVFHDPAQGITWQMGEPNLLAKLIKINVVADFRRRDIAYGGQGAPLVPIFHRALMKTLEKPLIVLNIGGVANLTFIGDNNELIAFDTGPGNALIDDLAFRLFNKQFDDKGELASKGKVDQDLVDEFLNDKYFSLKAPKSLDRNHFSYMLDRVSHLESKYDQLATITYLTVAAIQHAISYDLKLQFVKNIFVCGGGVKNFKLMDSLRALYKQTNIETIDSIGFKSDFIESQAFAYLAVRYLKKLPSSFPTTTATSRELTAGSYFSFE